MTVSASAPIVRSTPPSMKPGCEGRDPASQSSLRKHYPIVVIGAGPTGLMLSNLLGGHGVGVLLIEAHASTVGEPRAVSIDDESLRAVQAAGLAEPVLGKVIPGYGSEYFRANGRLFLKVHPTDQPYGYPRRNAFRQPALEAQLREGLKRFTSVQTLFSTRLQSFTQQADRVLLTVVDPYGSSQQFECDYLVGCDGASSTVRAALGIALVGRSFAERWLIVDLEDSPVASRETQVFCAPQRPCIALPGPDGTRRFEFKLHAHEDADRMLQAETIDALLRQHGAAPGSRLCRKVVYTFHARVAERWSIGRVLLAGDAAHLSPPFAGQGMNSGIRDAVNLAWKLWAVTAGLLGPKLLHSYELERRGHAWQMIKLALRMGRIMGPPNAFSAWLIQSGFHALRRWPRLRDYFSQMKYKPKPRFKRGFLLRDGLPTRTSLVGRLLPQPLVLRPDGTRVLLDEILGGDFCLLGRSVDARALCAIASLPQWQRLPIRAVVVEPPTATPRTVSNALGRANSHGATTLHVAIDQTGALQVALGGYAGRALLVRPDRYVAAAIDLCNPEHAASQLGQLLDLTHESAAACAAAVAPPARSPALGN